MRVDWICVIAYALVILRVFILIVKFVLLYQGYQKDYEWHSRFLSKRAIHNNNYDLSYSEAHPSLEGVIFPVLRYNLYHPLWRCLSF